MNRYPDRNPFRRLPPPDKPEPPDRLRRLLLFMGTSHACLKWVSGTFLMISLIFVTVIAAYFSYRAMVRCFDLITDWL